MIIVNKTEKSVAGAINGKPFSIPYNDKIYKELKKVEEAFNKAEKGAEASLAVKEAIKLTTLNFGELVALKNEYLMFNVIRNEYYLVLNKGKKNEYIDDRAIPSELSTMINDSFESDFDYMPLIKSWIRFLQRDKEYIEEDAKLFSEYLSAIYIDTDRVKELVETEGLTTEAAQELAEFNDIAVTQEGLLATYKVVDEVKTKWVIVLDDEGNPIVIDGQPQKKKVLNSGYQ